MKYFLLSIISILSGSTWTQVNAHYNHWQDSFTIQRHITEYINNVMGVYANNSIWDEKTAKYVSYIPIGLTYEKGRGKTYYFEETAANSLKDYFRGELKNVTGRSLNAIADSSRVSMFGNISYDSKGRVKEVTRNIILFEGHSEEHETIFDYIELKDSLKLRVVVKSIVFDEKAHYESAYTGKIRGRALKRESTWTVNLTFDKQGQLVYANHESKAFANGVVNSRQGLYESWFEWDERGRLLRAEHTEPPEFSDEIIEVDSLDKKAKMPSKIIENKYEFADFDLERDSEKYTILKVPQIKKWLVENYDPDKLSLMHSLVDRSNKTELLYDNHLVLMVLDSFAFRRIKEKTGGEDSNQDFINATSLQRIQTIYDRISDDTGAYLTKFEITQLPNLKDTAAYDPNYHKKMNADDLQAIRDPNVIHKQPGVIFAMHVARADRSVLVLSDGWKMYAYRLGSESNQDVALGHRVPIRLDILQDNYVFVDENNDVQFYYTYGKLFRIVEVKK